MPGKGKIFTGKEQGQKNDCPHFCRKEGLKNKQPVYTVRLQVTAPGPPVRQKRRLSSYEIQSHTFTTTAL
jgi:hypothetical protein